MLYTVPILRLFNSFLAVDAISNQGVTYMQQGRLRDALPLLQQVLEQRQQILPADDPLIGDTLRNFAIFMIWPNV